MFDNIQQESTKDFMAIVQAIKKCSALSSVTNAQVRNLWIKKSVWMEAHRTGVLPDTLLVLWCGTLDLPGITSNPDLLTFVGFEIRDGEANIKHMSNCFRTEYVQDIVLNIWCDQWYALDKKSEDLLYDYIQRDRRKERVLLVGPDNELRFPVEQHHLVPKHLAKQLFNKHTCDTNEQWQMYKLEEPTRSKLLELFSVEDEDTEVDILISNSPGADEYVFLMMKESLVLDEFSLINKISLYMFRHDTTVKCGTYSRFLTYLEDGNLDFVNFMLLCNGKIVINTVTKFNNVSRDVREFMVTTQFQHLLDPMEEVKNYEKLKIKTN